MAARMSSTARVQPADAASRRAVACTTSFSPACCSIARASRQLISDVRSSGVRFPVVSTRALDTKTESNSVNIEQLDRNYCDDFVCTSSPAIEQTVRSFARDLERGVRYTPSLFAKDVKYSDGYRSFSGAGPYSRQTWVQEAVKAPKAVVTRVQMLDKSSAQIDWRLSGQVGMAPFEATLTSTIELHMLTGKILSHKESWDVSKLPAPVSVMVNASRASWSAKQTSLDAQEGLNKMAESISSLGSTDEDSGQIYRDPTDPTKFFQQNQNDNYNDMITFAMVMVAMYAVYQGFATVLKL